jgi:hypothetical protein
MVAGALAVGGCGQRPDREVVRVYCAGASSLAQERTCEAHVSAVQVRDRARRGSAAARVALSVAGVPLPKVERVRRSHDLGWGDGSWPNSWGGGSW